LKYGVVVEVEQDIVVKTVAVIWPAADLSVAIMEKRPYVE
jgi:hypothetical protein